MTSPLFVDGTFGGGGYSDALLTRCPKARVLGIDRDADAIRDGAGLADRHKGRLVLRHGPYSRMETFLNEAFGPDPHTPVQCDGVALDLGLSSRQLADRERGFSFQADGPLDMRFDRGPREDGPAAGGDRDNPTAADLLNTLDERAIADILFHYGEERASRRLAKAIVVAREDQPITTVAQLRAIVTRVLGSGAKVKRTGRSGRRRRSGSDGPRIDPATRTFQALRIAVNRELEELAHGLAAAERCLRPGGRLGVVSFHSLEDRIVKRFLRARAGGEGTSRHLPVAAGPAPSFRLIHRGAVKPGEAETARNPRARSARLRVAERLDTPPHPHDPEPAREAA